MKRADLIRHLTSHGCFLLREGGGHTMYRQPVRRRTAPVPRHREIPDNLVRKICDQLDVPRP